MTPSQSSDESYREYTRTAWNATAEKYRRLLRLFEPYGFDLLARLNPKIRDSALDLATGPGEPAMSIARMVGPDGRVVGIDLSERMVQLATRIAKERRIPGVTFRSSRIRRPLRGKCIACSDRKGGSGSRSGAPPTRQPPSKRSSDRCSSSRSRMRRDTGRPRSNSEARESWRSCSPTPDLAKRKRSDGPTRWPSRTKTNTSRSSSKGRRSVARSRKKTRWCRRKSSRRRGPICGNGNHARES
ncbi:MAG: methyltransferase domain-containing protein [Methanobacteriota archaeon]|nr:MAG: methyltransferase domain-containing protein [Euryarchaeota archaeon]